MSVGLRPREFSEPSPISSPVTVTLSPYREPLVGLIDRGLNGKTERNQGSPVLRMFSHRGTFSRFYDRPLVF